MLAEIDRARDALYAIPPDTDRDSWVRAGFAFHAAGGDFETFNDWSAQANNYQASDCRDMWRSIKPGKGLTAATLFKMAAENGWRMNGDKPNSKPVARPATKPIEPPRKPAPGNGAADVFGRLEPATNQHGYVVGNGAAGAPMVNLRVVPADDKLTIAGSSVAGYLVVPAHAPDGTLQSLQFIPPAGGKKLNLPGASMAGASFTVGWTVPGCLVVECHPELTP